jgi:hypothetical protein
MQEGKNNEKSREGIGKDKPCQATCGNKRWYYYTGSSGAFGATGTTFFHRGTGGKLQEEDQVNELALNTVLNWETTGNGALG